MSEPGSAPHRPLTITPDRAVHAQRRPYAVVDIGSNSVRLVIYDELGRAPLPRFNEKSLCRLAEGLEETGAIAEQGFRRTIEAARRFRAIVDAMGVARVDVLATEATRRASNGPALVAAILAEAGLEVRILSGQEEAHFAALGVISGFYRPSGLIGDMGGGSLEVAGIDDDRVEAGSVSLPLGALPTQALMTRYGDGAREKIDELLDARLPAGLTRPVFYPVGGGWRAFAKAHMRTRSTPVEVVHGYTLDWREVREFAKSIYRPSEKGAAKLKGIPSRRAQTMAAAALVLDRVLKKLKPNKVVFSALGVREGWLFQQLGEAERYLDPLVEGAQNYGTPLARVPAFAAALEPWTATLFTGETPMQQRLRVAACALSDVAWRDNQDLRATEWFERLIRFPFIGVTHAERVFIAAAIHARYGGSPDDSVLQPAIDLLSQEERQRALVLGRAMQLGYRLSGGVPQILEGAKLQRQGSNVTLQVGAHARVPDSEVVSGRLQLLADALGCRPMIVEVA